MALVAYANSDDSDLSDAENGGDNGLVASSSSSSSSLAKVSNNGLPDQSNLTFDDKYEAELEDIVKPSENELAMRQQILKKRKPVQIHLPSLCETDSESDDESNSRNNTKKLKTASAHGKCGLFSMLPPPVSATRLVPHKLTRPVAATLPPPKKELVVRPSTVSSAPSAAAVSSASSFVSSAVAVYGAQDSAAEDDCENDDEDTPNFFSLDSALKQNSFITCDKSSLPLDITSSSSEQSTVTSLNKSIVTEELCEPSSSGSAMYMQEPHTSYAVHPDHEMHVSSQLHVSVDEDEGDNINSSGTFENYIQDEQFLRLCGRKHSKHAVNIIDVHADDQLKDVDLTKNISEEVPNLMSHSKKNNKDMPSSQQKRKHQITFLAYKAKERELELKNQWAENKFNKRQAQSKYGF